VFDLFIYYLEQPDNSSVQDSVTVTI